MSHYNESIYIIIMDSLEIKKVYWNKEIELPFIKWTICGYSRSGFRTGFYVKELDTMFDAGLQLAKTPSNIFITHTHADHIAELPFTLISNTLVNIYIPSVAKDHLKKYIESMFMANFLSHQHNVHNANFIPVTMEPFEVVLNKSKFNVQVFKCDHSIPTLSYGFSEKKSKLKDEFIGKTSKEIIELKKQNIEITCEKIEKKFAYICDTSIKILDDHPEILDYKVIFIECTFLELDEVNMAIEKKHINFHQLLPFIKKTPDSHFMLFHFSMKYKDAEIEAYIDKQKEENNITNISCWVTI